MGNSQQKDNDILQITLTGKTFKIKRKNMTEQELLQMRDLAEDGKVQFKERITDKYDIGCEMVAFSNSRDETYIKHSSIEVY